MSQKLTSKDRKKDIEIRTQAIKALEKKLASEQSENQKNRLQSKIDYHRKRIEYHENRIFDELILLCKTDEKKYKKKVKYIQMLSSKILRG